MRDLSLLILLFNIIEANIICKCKNKNNCNNIKMDDCLSEYQIPEYKIRILNSYEYSTKSVCEIYSTNNCVKSYKRDIPNPDDRNDNIYDYKCKATIYKSGAIKCISIVGYVPKYNKIISIGLNYELLGFNISAEIEYSNTKLINFPNNDCGIYLILEVFGNLYYFMIFIMDMNMLYM